MHRFIQRVLLAILAFSMVAPASAQSDIIARGLAANNAALIKKQFTPLQVKAQRILRSAEKGITPIGTVMASPPTFTEGTAGANSTIISGNTISTPAYFISDTTKFDFIGDMTNVGGITYGNQGVSYLSIPTRRMAHGSGFAFCTDASVFDVALFTGALPLAVYVTDLATGVRARASTNDQTTTTSTKYDKWDFGSTGRRRIEIYAQYSGSAGVSFRGVNVPATASIWKCSPADQPRFVWLGDSWGDTGGATNTNSIKLLAPDYVGERLGLTSILSISQGGSGFMNDASGHGTYRGRIANGDIDISRVGAIDALVLTGSLNDRVANNAAWTDAAVQAEVTLTVQAAMAKQPGAIIFVLGPQVTRSVTTLQSTFDAIKAGTIAAANGDPRVVYLDNSPSGENVLFGATTGNITLYIPAGDGNHLNDLGNQNWGSRIGQMIVNAVRPLSGLYN